MAPIRVLIADDHAFFRFAKLQVADRAQAIIRARDKGLGRSL